MFQNKMLNNLLKKITRNRFHFQIIEAQAQRYFKDVIFCLYGKIETNAFMD
jgi:hypothetical protein